MQLFEPVILRVEVSTSFLTRMAYVKNFPDEVRAIDKIAKY